MDKVLKFFQILNQIVWIGVGLATIYSIYWFITQNPMKDVLKQFQSLTGSGSGPVQSLESNPQIQKLIQQYSK